MCIWTPFFSLFSSFLALILDPGRSKKGAKRRHFSDVVLLGVPGTLRGRLLECLGALPGDSRGSFGASGGHFASFWGVSGSILGALEASWTILGQCRSRLDPLRLFFYQVGRIASSNYQQIAANDSSKKQQQNAANSRSK